MSCSKNEIGERITNLRKECGLSQQELSAALHVSREVVAKWENGTRDLKTEHTIALADYFGITCDEILRGVKAENVAINKETGLTNEAIEILRTPLKAYSTTGTFDLFDKDTLKMLKTIDGPNLLDAVDILLCYEGECNILYNLANYLFRIFRPANLTIDENASETIKHLYSNKLDVYDVTIKKNVSMRCDMLNEYYLLEAQTGLRKLREICINIVQGKESGSDVKHSKD